MRVTFQREQLSLMTVYAIFCQISIALLVHVKGDRTLRVKLVSGRILPSLQEHFPDHCI
jgi:hypothetical protein